MTARETHVKWSDPRAKHAHAGLRLDRFLRFDPQEREIPTGAKAELARALAGIPRPDGYVDAFAAREALLRGSPMVRLARAEVLGRLVLGLGSKGSAEFGIHLDHTWGVPVLPGSALKGLAAGTAHHLYDGWQKPSGWPAAQASGTGDERTDREILFGTTDESGCVVFHDAWWIPSTNTASENLPLDQDVMTVHHADYYGGKNVAPTDFDSPTPIPFVTCRGAYLIALEGPPEWTEVALQLLTVGLEQLGLGAKTNAGYGRARLTREKTVHEAEQERQRERARQAREADLRFVERLRGQLRKPVEWVDELGRAEQAAGVPLESARDAMWRRHEQALRAMSADAGVRRMFEQRLQQLSPASSTSSHDGPAVERREVLVRFVPDKKAANRFELLIDVDGQQKSYKGHLVALSADDLERVKAAGEAGAMVMLDLEDGRPRRPQK